MQTTNDAKNSPLRAAGPSSLAENRRARASAVLARGAICLAALVAIAGCVSPVSRTPSRPEQSPEQQVALQLARYEDGIRRMDFDAVADLFAPMGELVNPGTPGVYGREAIRKFLHSFDGFKVLENADHAESVVFDGPSLKQVGTYSQTVVIPGGETVKVHGRFEALWERDDDGRWLLASLKTTLVE
jgi:uncharacterized protein (TIGR02246 family)